MSDGLTVLGPDGIRRSYDEHYDTMMDVEQDPTGAHQAIQRQHARIEELEVKLATVVAMALEECPFREGTGSYNDWWHDRRTTLAELTGGKDD